MRLETIKNAIQSCNINFIIGSGLSRPFLITLGNIEILLDELERSQESDQIKKKLIKASLYRRYFLEVMYKNLDYYTMTGDDQDNYDEVLTNYQEFLKSINAIVLHRYIPTLNKQVNIFTTNIDTFFEKALETTQLEFNDGFKGRLKPKFSLGNFQKSYSKTSLHYKNTSEIPVFNLIKVHGSINWKQDGDNIVLSNYDEFKSVNDKLSEIPEETFLTIQNDSTLQGLIDACEHVSIDEGKLDDFLEQYEYLQIVNPTKEKFKTTLLNTYYYELLRLFANEMEKENTLLFAMGFSFADEHIREITIRALNSNPTLQLYIIAYSEGSESELKKSIGLDDNRILNNNVRIINPVTYSKINKEDFPEIGEVGQFDFKNINEKLFSLIKRRVNPTIVKP